MRRLLTAADSTQTMRELEHADQKHQPGVWSRRTNVGHLCGEGRVGAAGHVLPDEQPEHVGVVVPTTRLNLLVLPDRVEAERLVGLEVRAQRGVGRSGVCNRESLRVSLARGADKSRKCHCLAVAVRPEPLV